MQESTIIIWFIIFAAVVVLMYLKQKQLGSFLSSKNVEQTLLSPWVLLVVVLGYFFSDMVDFQHLTTKISKNWAIVFGIALIFHTYNVFFKKKKDYFNSSIIGKIISLVVYIILVVPLIIYFIK